MPIRHIRKTKKNCQWFSAKGNEYLNLIVKKYFEQSNLKKNHKMVSSIQQGATTLEVSIFWNAGSVHIHIICYLTPSVNFVINRIHRNYYTTRQRRTGFYRRKSATKKDPVHAGWSFRSYVPHHRFRRRINLILNFQRKGELARTYALHFLSICR